jgi:ubiquitin fusion degradation protein 1
MIGFFGHGSMRGGQFEAQYRCYPVTFIDKAEAERGDKVFLPPSALDRLAQLHIDYPMLFQVENRRDDRRTHCGVLEFIADEGMIYMPYWMMQNLLLTEGDIVSLRSATLSKGSFVKLQPHSSDFLDISNPRAVLETTLRNFSCLTVGDTIPIHYNNKSYFIDIIEAKPANAISVIETDCNVDFAPPLDYKEPERRPAGFAGGGGGGGPEPMDAQPSGSSVAAAAAAAKRKGEETEGDAAAEASGPTFLAFSGSGMRLDGKPISSSQPVAIPMPGTRPSNTNASRSSSQPPEASGSGSAPKAGSSAGRKQGKLMFKDRLAAKFNDGKGAGSGAAAAPKPKVEEKKKEEEKEEDPKFKAFQGKSFSLK